MRGANENLNANFTKYDDSHSPPKKIDKFGTNTYT